MGDDLAWAPVHDPYDTVIIGAGGGGAGGGGGRSGNGSSNGGAAARRIELETGHERWRAAALANFPSEAAVRG
jgi:hypothetical protein